jgi:hypothetical protein
VFSFEKNAHLRKSSVFQGNIGALDAAPTRADNRVTLASCRACLCCFVMQQPRFMGCISNIERKNAATKPFQTPDAGLEPALF